MKMKDRNKLSGIKYNELHKVLLDDHQIGQFLMMLHEQPHFSRVSDETAALEEDYNRMCDFLLAGYPDKDRDALFAQMLTRAYTILQNLYLYSWLVTPQMRSYAAYADSPIEVETLRASLENHVQDVAMLQLESVEVAEKRKVELFEKHYTLMSRVFCIIAFSRQWTSELSGKMASLIGSPTIDTIDAQLLVGALYVAVTNVPDVEKLRALMKIYQDTTDEAIRQRALVALCFGVSDGCMPFDAQNQFTNELRGFFSHKSVAQELSAFILQVAICEQTGQANNSASKKVSSLFSSISLSMMNPPSEEDKLNGILHPEMEEEKMEKMSDNFEQLKDMLANGVDIYYQGFRHLKRSHFFYNLSNWFVPYYPEHPELKNLHPELLKSKILEKIEEKSPFCDSDKYSFIISLGQIYGQLPKQIREAAMTGELGPMPGIEGDSGSNNLSSVLQDLYRFHTLHPSESAFYSPFSIDAVCRSFSRLLEGCTDCEPYLRTVALQLSDREFHVAAISLYVLSSEMNVAQQHYELGKIYYRAGDYIKADKELGLANLDEPNNDEFNRLYANAAFKSGDIDTAGTLLQTLCEKYPDEVPLGLMLGKVYYRRQEYKEAASLLYKYYYMNPGETEVMRYLGIALISSLQPEKALRILGELTATDKAIPMDFCHKGLAEWMTGNRQEAVNSFAEYLKRKKSGSDTGTLQKEIHSYAELLKEFGIGSYEIAIMCDLAYIRYHGRTRGEEG